MRYMDMLCAPFSFSLNFTLAYPHTHTHTHSLSLSLCRLDSSSSAIARGYESVLKQGGRLRGWANRADTSHQSPCRPRGAGGRGRCPTGTCRSSVLGAVIFLSATDLMTEPRGLITPPSPSPSSCIPPSTSPPSSTLLSVSLLSYPGACQRVPALRLV